jgi:hypothetical protein
MYHGPLSVNELRIISGEEAGQRTFDGTADDVVMNRPPSSMNVVEHSQISYNIAEDTFMLVENLAKYEPIVDNSFDKFGIADMAVKNNGTWVKLEDAKNAIGISLNSLRQLKTEIALIADEVEKINSLPSGCYHFEIIPIVLKLRQLSAVSTV